MTLGIAIAFLFFGLCAYLLRDVAYRTLAQTGDAVKLRYINDAIAGRAARGGWTLPDPDWQVYLMVHYNRFDASSFCHERCPLDQPAYFYSPTGPYHVFQNPVMGTPDCPWGARISRTGIVEYLPIDEYRVWFDSITDKLPCRRGDDPTTPM